MKVLTARMPCNPRPATHFYSVNKCIRKLSAWIALQRWEIQNLVYNDSNSCMMYSYNWCWLAGWLAETSAGGVWETHCQGHFSVSDTQSCHLPFIYALKGLESGGKASNFTYINTYVRLFVFLSSSWDEHKRIYVTTF